MCGTCSNFENNRIGITGYSNFTDSELRVQCAQENNLSLNDPSNKYLLDSCVADKKKSQPKGQQVVGYIQTGANVAQQVAGIFQGLFGKGQLDTGYNMPNQEPKGLGLGAIIGIGVGVILLGVGIYYVAKPKGK